MNKSEKVQKKALEAALAMFKTINKGTVKLKTDIRENVFGGT